VDFMKANIWHHEGGWIEFDADGQCAQSVGVQMSDWLKFLGCVVIWAVFWLCIARRWATG